jgi:hypothetical protein
MLPASVVKPEQMRKVPMTSAAISGTLRRLALKAQAIPRANGIQATTISQNGKVPGAAPAYSSVLPFPVTWAAISTPMTISASRNAAQTSRVAPAEIRPTVSSDTAADR